MRWDPEQYGRYTTERARPFFDLVGRIDAAAPRQVVDLGCGPGALTGLLHERWPTADVLGIDNSAEMIAAAATVPGVRFELGDVADFVPRPETDVIVSNATLQWVPGHLAMLRSWAAAVPAGGWLAIQVPGNFAAPAHALMRALAASPRWKSALDGVLRHDTVATPAEYATVLLDAGLTVDAWETTYLHVLPGADPVLEWLRGTGLRPVLGALSPADAEEFSAAFAEQLRQAYPAGPHGTLFPFRRIFAVGRRPS